VTSRLRVPWSHWCFCADWARSDRPWGQADDHHGSARRDRPRSGSRVPPSGGVTEGGGTPQGPSRGPHRGGWGGEGREGQGRLAQDAGVRGHA